MHHDELRVARNSADQSNIRSNGDEVVIHHIPAGQADGIAPYAIPPMVECEL